MIKQLYERLKQEIEYQKGVKIAELKITDKDGKVQIKAIPSLSEIDINFDQPITQPIAPTPSDVVVAPTDNHDGVIIIWGSDLEVLAFSVAKYNIYRKVPADSDFHKIAENVDVTKYIDAPLASGTYVYYIVSVDETGREGIPTSPVTISI
jgi:hypothetical protein